MEPFCREYDNVNFFDICKLADDVRLSDFPTVFQGKCFNHILGKCRFTEEKCGHKHVPGLSLDDEDVDTFVKLVQPGVTKMIQDGPLQKYYRQGEGRRS